MLEVWQRVVHEHLQDVLELCKSNVLRARKHRIIGPIDFILEMTIPWGMDDGNGLVRLTILEAPYEHDSNSAFDPRRVKVVVAADARPLGFFPGDPKAIVEVPRFVGVLQTWERVPADMASRAKRSPSNLTTNMATYLQERTNGGPIKDEGDGSLSFVILAWPEPLEPLWPNDRHPTTGPPEC